MFLRPPIILLGVALAAIALFSGLNYVGFGILVGGALAFLMIREGMPSKSLIDVGGVIFALGCMCLLGAYCVAWKNGITFEELDSARAVPKYLRRLPYYGVVGITISVVMVVFKVAGPENEI